MIKWNWLLRPHMRRAAHAITYAVYAVVGVLMLFWSTRAVLASYRVQELRTSIKHNSSAYLQSRRAFESVDITGREERAQGLGVITKFQQEVERAGVDAGVKVQEFSATPVLVGYLTHFSSNPDSKGYQQVHVLMSIDGELGRLVSMFERLGSVSTPFEYGSIEITPDPQSRDAYAANARIELDLLTKSEGS